MDEPHLVEVERRIRMINEAVKIKRATKSKVDMDFIMGTSASRFLFFLVQDDMIRSQVLYSTFHYRSLLALEVRTRINGKSTTQRHQ